MTCGHCGATLPEGALFCGACGRRVSARPRRDIGRSTSTASAPTVPVAIASTEPPATPAPPAVDDERTVVVRRAAPPARFQVVASTGQRFEVTGRALLGRKPQPPPGERYEAVLVVVDPGKTVSKTHLELLVVGGALHVVDLGSGNGTVIDAPQAEPVRLEPGVPHPAPPGTRLTLGHQWLTIE